MNYKLDLIDHLIESIMVDDHILVEKILKENKTYVGRYEDNGVTPLHFAVVYSALNSIGVLIKYGADISNYDDNGVSALDLARKYKLKECEGAMLQQKKRGLYEYDINSLV